MIKKIGGCTQFLYFISLQNIHSFSNFIPNRQLAPGLDGGLQQLDHVGEVVQRAQLPLHAARAQATRLTPPQTGQYNSVVLITQGIAFAVSIVSFDIGFLSKELDILVKIYGPPRPPW